MMQIKERNRFYRKLYAMENEVADQKRRRTRTIPEHADELPYKLRRVDRDIPSEDKAQQIEPR